jgi:hypothetical protein
LPFPSEAQTQYSSARASKGKRPAPNIIINLIPVSACLTLGIERIADIITMNFSPQRTNLTPHPAQNLTYTDITFNAPI